MTFELITPGMILVTKQLKRVFGEDNKTTETYAFYPRHYHGSLLKKLQVYGGKSKRWYWTYSFGRNILLAL